MQSIYDQPRPGMIHDVSLSRKLRLVWRNHPLIACINIIILFDFIHFPLRISFLISPLLRECKTATLCRDLFRVV